jgi:hypothetical protein
MTWQLFFLYGTQSLVNGNMVKSNLDAPTEKFDTFLDLQAEAGSIPHARPHWLGI